MLRIREEITTYGSNWRMWMVLACLLFAGANTVPAMSQSADEKDVIKYLKSLSLEDLAALEVTSASKKAEKLTDAVAAAFVITNEDIRRSGVTNIPEALRMVPGIQVAHVDANKWAVTARGFNGSFASKLLVMIDGRTVYSPLWSGVFWNVQDTMLEDIDRIEVIRGPGASLWGANAVNGIINIITKNAKDTQGGLVTGGIGTEERGFTSARYGLQPSKSSYLRFYAKYFDRDDRTLTDGEDGNDQWSGLRGGFRLDWEPTANDSFTMQGDAYSIDSGVTYNFASLTSPSTIDTVLDDSKLRGGNLMSRWEHTASNDSHMALQVYYDRTEASDQLIDEVRNTFDIDFQHRIQINTWNDFIWGLGYRSSRGDTEDQRNTRFDPKDHTMELYNFFLQDQITLVPDRLWLTLGSKFENQTYTDWEIQPTGRFLWKPKENHSIWGAVSRALRTPSRAERDVQFDFQAIPPSDMSPFPSMVQITGSDSFEPEEVISYELGYRLLVSDRMLWDVAAFYNDYEKLNSTWTDEPIFVPGPSPYVLIPERIFNDSKITSKGIEVALDLNPKDWWRVDVAYTYLDIEEESGGKHISESSPRNQFSLRSSMDIGKNFEFDIWVRYVDELKIIEIEDYLTFDARLGWKPTKNWEFALVGQNLAENQHMEFSDLFLPVQSTEVERSAYAKVTWTF